MLENSSPILLPIAFCIFILVSNCAFDIPAPKPCDAAKVFYQLSRDGVPILDLQLRYKGDFKSMPQFFATITDEFQKQMDELCLVQRPGRVDINSLLNRTLMAY